MKTVKKKYSAPVAETVRFLPCDIISASGLTEIELAAVNPELVSDIVNPN